MSVLSQPQFHDEEVGVYFKAAPSFIDHQTTAHGQAEYVHGIFHRSNVENYFFPLKHGMKDVYKHCGKQPLHGYLAEFDFRYNNRIALGAADAERAGRAIQGIGSKRLIYRGPNSALQTKLGS